MPESREKLFPVARYRDAEIEVLYRRLMKFRDEPATNPDRVALVEKIKEVETERANEMSARFWWRNPLAGEAVDDLIRKADEALDE